MPARIGNKRPYADFKRIHSYILGQPDIEAETDTC